VAKFVPEDEVLARARARADELGCRSVAPGTGVLLRLLAASLAARSVVEVGTGAGVSGVYLLRGMPGDGTLTTIDAEVENQRAAREAFAEAGVRSNRVRTIAGRAADVLPRLADGAYDLVVVDAEADQLNEHLDQALRLLRPGGLLVVDGALADGRVCDPALRDPATTAARDALKQVRDDSRLTPALLPIGGGLLLAVREGEAIVPPAAGGRTR
jgi:predicted O-methyltransferase YrrM